MIKKYTQYIYNIILLVFCLLFCILMYYLIYKYYYISKISYYPNQIHYIPNNKKVLIFNSVSYETNPEYMQYSQDLNEIYCNKWNYHYKIFNHKVCDIPPYWLRVRDLLTLLETTNYELICYMDIDAVFINHDIELYSLVNYIEQKSNHSYDMFIGEDPNPLRLLNTGVFIIKNTDWSKNFIKNWLNNCINKLGKLHDICSPWEYNNKHWTCNNCDWAGESYEQGNLEDMFNNNILNSKNKITILRQLFLSNEYKYTDSFVKHFMGNKNGIIDIIKNELKLKKHPKYLSEH